MKPRLITLMGALALALGAVVAVKAGHPGGHGPAHHSLSGHLDALTKDLNLTADQQLRVKPIIEQAKPQVQAIHEEAMEKMKSVMETTVAQLRPLLTAEQQQKVDAIRKAHDEMRNAMKELHEAKRQ